MLSIPADGRILYFRRDRARFRFLSHFWPSPIALQGALWPTVEHFYQAQKSADPGYRATIREAPTPAEAKSRADHWFRISGAALPADWPERKLRAMREADAAKFGRYPDLAALLRETGTAELIEDSPDDAFWGIGPDGQGLNWAGRVLMEVREALRSV